MPEPRDQRTVRHMIGLRVAFEEQFNGQPWKGEWVYQPEARYVVTVAGRRLWAYHPGTSRWYRDCWWNHKTVTPAVTSAVEPPGALPRSPAWMTIMHLSGPGEVVAAYRAGELSEGL